MSITVTPLRYPGGKSFMASFIEAVLSVNGTWGKATYAEPYAGGAGAAIALLQSGAVKRILLNDASYPVYCFWRSILTRYPSFVAVLDSTTVSIAEWHRQRSIFMSPDRYDQLEVGFAALFLNRCNRSGILRAGPIGGKSQAGTWKLDVRFNKDDLRRKLAAVHKYRGSISVSNLDAIRFVKKAILPMEATRQEETIVYLDPPYYEKGRDLYYDHYGPADHRALSMFLRHEHTFRWMLSYDNVQQIRDLYADHEQHSFTVNYTAQDQKPGKELLINSRNCALPESDVMANTRHRTIRLLRVA